MYMPKKIINIVIMKVRFYLVLLSMKIEDEEWCQGYEFKFQKLTCKYYFVV